MIHRLASLISESMISGRTRLLCEAMTKFGKDSRSDFCRIQRFELEMVGAGHKFLLLNAASLTYQFGKKML